MAASATTVTFGQVLDLVSQSIPRSHEADFAARVANRATNELWNAFDWRETIAALPPFYLTPGEQDHGSPQVSIPSNFSGLRTAAYITTRSGAATPTRFDLRILRNLELDQTRGFPRNISYEPSISGFRIFPRVPDNFGVPFDMIVGRYKTIPTKLTSSTYPTTVVPVGGDESFDVWYEVAKWAAMSFLGDSRAGSVSMQGNAVQRSGQYAIAWDYITQMAANEGFQLGNQAISPSESLLGVGHSDYGFGSNAFPGGF